MGGRLPEMGNGCLGMTSQEIGKSFVSGDR